MEKLDAEETKRRTKITNIELVDVREVVKRDIALRYDATNGYLGTQVPTGKELIKVSPLDRIVILRKSGVYTITDVPEKLFVDKGMWHAGLADKDEIAQVLFTIVYMDPKTKQAYIKKCRIEQYIMNRDYLIVPDGMKILFVEKKESFSFTLKYVEKPRVRILEETFFTDDYDEKGIRAQGVRLSIREVKSLAIHRSTVKKTPEKKTSAAKKTVKKEASTKVAAKAKPKTATKKTSSKK